MQLRALVLGSALLGCGGGGAHTATPRADDQAPIGIALEPVVAMQTWYRSPSVCGQGPYEIEVPLANVRWGEELEVRLATPRRIALTAVVFADDDEVAKTAALFDREGRGHGKAENLRCVADGKQRLAAVRGAGGGTPGHEVPVGTTLITTPPAGGGGVAQLEIDDGPAPERSFEVVRFGWREHDHRPRRLRLRLWSVEPNDLELVRFGIARIEWRPNVPEAEYEAYLVQRAETERRRLEQDDRARADAAARAEAAAAEYARTHPIDPAEAAAARRRAEQAAREQLERARRDAAQRAEEARRRAVAAALETERARRRQAYCEAHPGSRDCWGAGGKRRYLELAERVRERARYCADHREDFRCWSSDELARRREVWHQRVRVATAPPKQPDGPPPAPRAEDQPPKLSTNAEWRAGYWLWTGETWVWLGGMWRVPEADIVAEQTTTAPVAPPPPREEPIPPPPRVGVRTTVVWVNGFWQWSGRAYVWVAGSYQARPEVGVTWRPTAWRARGAVHVLVPGGWVPLRGGRR